MSILSLKTNYDAIILTAATLFISGKSVTRKSVPYTVYIALHGYCYLMIQENVNPYFTTTLVGYYQAAIRTVKGTISEIWADDNCSDRPVYFEP